MDYFKKETETTDEYHSDESTSSLNQVEIKNPIKRKLPINDDSNKKTKLNKKNNLNHPPTAGELSKLKETENLFKSNLFRLQLDSLISEIKVKKKYEKIFNVWVNNFEKELESLPEYEVKLSKIKKNHKTWFIAGMPKTKPFYKTDQDFAIKLSKPENCEVFGLHDINCSVGPTLIVNLNLTIPKKCFHEKDYLNNRLLAKCECYLLYTYYQLQKSELCNNVEFCPENLTIKLYPSTSDKIQVVLHVVPSSGTFKLSRFEPDKNNFRVDLFEDCDVPKRDDCGTPFYNSQILSHLTLVSNYTLLKSAIVEGQNIQDSVKLLQVWLKRRRLQGVFDEVLITQTILYLIIKKKINKFMSSYQVIRNFWIFLSTTDWHTNPISICEDIKPEKFKVFRDNFDIIFLDQSGSYNLAAFLHLDLYLKVKHEATSAVQFLDDNYLDSFQALFVVDMEPLLQYDAILRIEDNGNFKAIYQNIGDILKYRYINCNRLAIMKRILHYLRKGLNKRILHIVPLENSNSQEMLFGLTFSAENVFNNLEKGPSSNTCEAIEFRKFWENLADCRRFADGSICEAVYFPTSTMYERRQIFKKIVHFVLTKKLHLSNYSLMSNELEQAILSNEKTALGVDTCEEATLKAITTFDELAKKLRGLSLPLEVTMVQGASEVFSYSETFPPLSSCHRGGGKITTVTETNILLKEKLGCVPKYVYPINCVLQLGLNSKWPNNLEALRHLKTGFYIEVGKLLAQSEIITNVTHEYLQVFYEGLVFRFRLCLQKELLLIKRFTKADGTVSYKEIEESIRMETNLVVLPKVIGALNGIQSQHSSFGTATCLIKRWMRSHLIDDYHVPDIVISLLSASLYLAHAPYLHPNLPQVAFLRFMQFLMDFNWESHFVLVNFNNIFARDVLDKIEMEFHNNRQNYPLLYIVTPFDEGGSIFSKRCSKEIMNRLKLLAKATYSHISNLQMLNSVESLFTPNLEGYNILIHLKPLMNAKRHQQFSFDNQIAIKEYEKGDDKMPVVDFNPVEIYLKDLRENYDHLALFFHDPYGGNVIGVLWRPAVSQQQEFKVSHITSNKLQGKKLILNVEAVLEDFYIIGTGVVKTIEEKTAIQS